MDSFMISIFLLYNQMPLVTPFFLFLKYCFKFCLIFQVLEGFYTDQDHVVAFLLKCSPHPRSWDNHGQETFLAPSADKQTPNYNIY